MPTLLPGRTWTIPYGEHQTVNQESLLTITVGQLDVPVSQVCR